MALECESAPPAVHTLHRWTPAETSEVLAAPVVDLLAAAEAPLVGVFPVELGVRIPRRRTAAALRRRA